MRFDHTAVHLVHKDLCSLRGGPCKAKFFVATKREPVHLQCMNASGNLVANVKQAKASSIIVFCHVLLATDLRNCNARQDLELFRVNYSNRLNSDPMRLSVPNSAENSLALEGNTNQQDPVNLPNEDCHAGQSEYFK
jgi:hypothetical protein